MRQILKSTYVQRLQLVDLIKNQGFEMRYHGLGESQSKAETVPSKFDHVPKRRPLQLNITRGCPICLHHDTALGVHLLYFQ